MPNSLPPNGTPPDMIFLLGKIDGKLDTLIQRQGEHETRLGAIETELGDRAVYKRRFETTEATVEEHDDILKDMQTTARNFRLIGGILWTVFGSAILAIGGKMIGLL